MKLGLWPAGMAPTLDREVLGIAEEDVDAAAKEARREAEERAAKARSVRFNDRDVDPEHADWTAISAEIAAKLSRPVKAARLTAPTELTSIEKRPPRQPKNGASRAIFRRAGPHAASEEGPDRPLGELVVYRWLKDRFRNQDIDKAWVLKVRSAAEGQSVVGRSRV